MSPPLNKGAFIKNENLITKTAATKPMADEKRRSVIDDLAQMGIDFRFCNWIQRSGGFIQDQKGSIFVQSSCYGDLLGLPAGDTSLGLPGTFPRRG